MWPFRKRPTTEEAIATLAEFYVRMQYSDKIGARDRNNPTLYWATSRCLAMMLGREPTADEIFKVYDSAIPF